MFDIKYPILGVMCLLFDIIFLLMASKIDFICIECVSFYVMIVLNIQFCLFFKLTLWKNYFDSGKRFIGTWWQILKISLKTAQYVLVLWPHPKASLETDQYVLAFWSDRGSNSQLLKSYPYTLSLSHGGATILGRKI